MQVTPVHCISLLTKAYWVINYFQVLGYEFDHTSKQLWFSSKELILKYLKNLRINKTSKWHNLYKRGIIWDMKNNLDKKYLVVLCFVLMFIIACLSWKIYPTHLQSIVIALIASLISFVIGFLVTQLMAINQNQQIKGCKTIKKKDSNSDISIYELKHQFDDKLPLSWKTFGEGIELLYKYSSLFYRSLYPDIICGINEAGIMIASYFHGKRASANKDFGYFFMGSSSGEKRNVDNYYLPEWNEQQRLPIIFLIDSEIKSGITGKTAIEMIKEKYKDKDKDEYPVIKYICLCGVVENNIEEIRSVSDFGWKLKKDEKEYAPHLLAYYILKPGFEPPGIIR